MFKITTTTKKNTWGFNLEKIIFCEDIDCSEDCLERKLKIPESHLRFYF